MSEDPDLHTLTGAYALDAVDDVERARVERLLRESPEAAAEVASFRETAARLGAAATTPAPPSLRASVLAEIRTTRQLPPVTAPADRRDGGAGRTAARWLSVAAACLLAVSLGLGAWVVDLREQNEQSRIAAEAIPNLLSDPDRQVMETDFAGGKATVVVADGEVVLFGSGVAAPPEGRGYQLWMLDEENRPRPSVMLTATGAGGFFAEASGFQPGEKVAVTIEPETGSSSPTTDPVFIAGA